MQIRREKKSSKDKKNVGEIDKELEVLKRSMCVDRKIKIKECWVR